MPVKKLSIKSDLTKVDRHRIVASEYEDAPQLSAEQLAGATVKRRGRPPIDVTAKKLVTLRIDDDVQTAYRKTGQGWQARINADLRKVRKLG